MYTSYGKMLSMPQAPPSSPRPGVKIAKTPIAQVEATKDAEAARGSPRWTGFARRYVRRAASQHHHLAVERMRELRSCALCGAEDAAWACAFCRQVRYCDYYETCCVKHWREGGGVGGGMSGGEAAARHKDVCSRRLTTNRRTRL